MSAETEDDNHPQTELSLKTMDSVKMIDHGLLKSLNEIRTLIPQHHTSIYTRDETDMASRMNKTRQNNN